jgi:hypothetical protein
MRHLVRTTTRTRSLAVSAVIALALGCASLPPAQPATDLKAIAGEWRGTGQGRDGSTRSVTMTITEDGRFTSVFDQPVGSLGTTFPGTVKVENGRYRFQSEKTGNTGTFTLHEGQGKRVLTTRADNGSSAAELVPARP